MMDMLHPDGTRKTEQELWQEEADEKGLTLAQLRDQLLKEREQLIEARELFEEVDYTDDLEFVAWSIDLLTSMIGGEQQRLDKVQQDVFEVFGPDSDEYEYVTETREHCDDHIVQQVFDVFEDYVQFTRLKKEDT